MNSNIHKVMSLAEFCSKASDGKWEKVNLVFERLNEIPASIFELPSLETLVIGKIVPTVGHIAITERVFKGLFGKIDSSLEKEGFFINSVQASESIPDNIRELSHLK